MTRKLKGQSKRVRGAAFSRMKESTMHLYKKEALKKRKRPVPKTFPAKKPDTDIAVGRFSKGIDGYFQLSQKDRINRELKLAQKDGEDSVVGALRAVQIKQKNNSPGVSKAAQSDANIVAGSMKNKKRVKFPEGFSPNRGKKKIKLPS